MTDLQKFREFWIYIGEIDDIVFTQPKHLKNQDKYIHVLEAGPVLENIRRLEAALQKCKEQRGICTEIHANGLCRYQIMEKEIESILEGR